jgi:transcriptional regulator with XRE-family HTH domain
MNKARKYKSQLIDELLEETTPLEMEQTKTKMQIAAKIEDFLKLKGWSKSEFAQKVGKNPSEITKWLSGVQNFTIDVLIEIAIAFEINISELFKQNKEQVIYRKRIAVKSSRSNAFINLSTPYVYTSDLTGGSVLTFQEDQIAYSTNYNTSK